MSSSNINNNKRKRGALAKLLDGDDSDDESDNDDINHNNYDNNNNNVMKLNSNDNNNVFLQNVNNVIDSKSLESYVKKKPIGVLQLLRGDFDDDDDEDDNNIKNDNDINYSIKKAVQNIASSNTLVQKKSLLELMDSARQEVKESLSNKNNKIKKVENNSKESFEFHDGVYDRKKLYNSKEVRPNLETEAKGPFEPINLDGNDSSEVDQNKLGFYVNKYASRYLLKHQREGVKWLAEKYFEQQGCILGDDMGMVYYYYDYYYHY